MKQRTIRYRPSMLDIYADAWHWELTGEQTSQYFGRLSAYHGRQAEHFRKQALHYRRKRRMWTRFTVLWIVFVAIPYWVWWVHFYNHWL